MASSSPLILGRLADNFWIVGSPVVALLVLASLWAWSGLSDLTIFAVLFGFIVTGHHLPGWFRAFGEPAVYSRYKARLWVSLLAVPALVILPTAYGLGAAALTVAALFDLWHVAMQQHGFGRIYAAKAGDVDGSSAKLDLVCVLTWYATAVAWSDSWMESIARTLRRAGLPLFNLVSADVWQAVRWVLLTVSVALAAGYVLRAVKLWREKRVSTPVKHWLHAVAFGVIIVSYQNASWFRAQSVQNLFHALQYFFIVWIYGHLSIRRDPERPSAFYRTLFRDRFGILLFAGVVGLYGTGALLLSSSGYRLTGVDAERAAQVIGSVGLASLLLHFYVDSFIWKVRSRPVRTALAIGSPQASPEPAALREPPWRGVLHALAYFGLPVALVVLLGARGRLVSPELDRAALAKEAALFPRSAMGRFLNGRAAFERGDPSRARRELSAALALSPRFEGPAALLAQLDVREGDREAEIEHAAAAVRAAPGNAALHYALGNALAFRRRLDEAEEQYRETIRLRPRFAGAEENLGVLYKWRGQLEDALPHFSRAYHLDPNLSSAACDLSGALATLGKTDEALAVLVSYRARHPRDGVAEGLERSIRADAEARPSNTAR